LIAGVVQLPGKLRWDGGGDGRNLRWPALRLSVQFCIGIKAQAPSSRSRYQQQLSKFEEKDFASLLWERIKKLKLSNKHPAELI
jgi:hypothetical protein